jgi:hypothetical protein
MASKSFASASVAIVATPSRVWDVLVHVEQWPEWTPTVVTAERLDAGPLALGSRTRIHQPKLRPAVWQVTELDPAKGVFVWIARSPGITVTAGHYIHSTPLGSHARLTIGFSGVLAPLVRLKVGKLTRQYVQTEAESLKQRSETWRQQRTGS